MEKVLDKIIKYGLRLLVFLLPFWFLPLTASPLNANKQIFLAAFVFLLLILWLVKILIEGKMRFVRNKLNLAVLLLFSVVLISALFSFSKSQSFWGMDFEFDALFGFGLYAILFFLFANLPKDEEISKFLWVFVFSAEILSLLFLIQLFRPVFPLGSISSLAVFLAAALAVIVSRLKGDVSFKKRLLNWFTVLPPFLVLFLLNYWSAWLAVIFAMAVIIFAGFKKLSFSSSTTNPLKPLFPPLFVLALAATFIFLKLPIEKIVSLPPEITPTYSATVNIAAETLKSGPKNLIIGSGPATFPYQYSLYRQAASNFGDFWRVRFNQGAAALPTFLATLGVAGVLAFLFIMALFFWQGVKRWKARDFDQTNLAIFAAAGCFMLSWFLFPGDIVLMVFAFLLLGLWSAAEAGPGESGAKEFSFNQSPQKAFFLMLFCVLLLVGSVWTLYNVSKKYAGAIIYAQGLNLINAETPKLDEGIIAINKAINLDPKDSYFRNLSQAIIFKISEALNDSELSEEQKKNALQKLVSDAEVTAMNATKINPANSQNWLQQGNVYENFAALNVAGADNLAILNYQKAADLDPKNPQIPFNLGRVYKLMAEKGKSQYFDSALEELKKSTELKSDFSAAFSLTQQVLKMKEENK